MRFMFFPFFLLFVDKKRKAPMFVYDAKKRRKKVKDGGNVVLSTDTLTINGGKA